jgi:hypothetical protein
MVTDLARTLFSLVYRFVSYKKLHFSFLQIKVLYYALSVFKLWVFKKLLVFKLQTVIVTTYMSICAHMRSVRHSYILSIEILSAQFIIW